MTRALKAHLEGNNVSFINVVYLKGGCYEGIKF